MFDTDAFVEACKNAVGDGQKAVREVVTEAVSDPAAVIKALGEPVHAGIVPLYRAADLTVIHFTWAPNMSLMPHNHQMFSVVGVYDGREDNVFWRRVDGTIEAAGADSLGAANVATLGRDIIHSVVNPIGKMTSALHVYGGDFFAPAAPRSQWDHETLVEMPWNIDHSRRAFKDAETRSKVGAVS